MTGIDAPTVDGDETEDRRTRSTGAARVTGGASDTRTARVTAVFAGIGACALLAAAFAILAVAALATGSVVAGDNVAIFRPDPAELEAEPGDEFAVDVVMTSHGGYGDVGVVAVDFVARYHPDYLEVVDVEAGPWLERGNETDVRRSTTVANDDGVTLLEQRRDPPAGGATGEAVLVTVTFRVPDDAEPARATVDFAASEVLLESRYLQPIHDRNVTVTVDGGEARPEGYDHPPLEDVGEGSSTDDGSGSGTDDGTASTDGSASDGDGTGTASSDGGESEDDTDAGSGGGGTEGAADSSDGTGAGDDSSAGGGDPTVGFTSGVAAAALGTVLVALAIGRRRR